MSTDWQPRRTSATTRGFKVWFGGIFLAIGLVALLIGTVLYVVLTRQLGADRIIWAFLGAPLGIGIVFTLVGGTFFWLGRMQARKRARLLQSGTTTEATILAIEPTSTRINRRILWHIRYTYEDLYGVVHPGESGYLEPEDAQSYRVGGTAYVRYDPASPATSLWLGREELPEQI